MKKNRIISITILIVMVIGAVFTSIYFLSSNKQLIYNYIKGAIALERVESAQYVPSTTTISETFNISNLSSVIHQAENAPVHINNISSNETPANAEFTDLIDKYANMASYSGAGKYLGYDIFEVKNEIAFVVEHVPAFNQWFRMPIMRTEEGYVSIPYYESWAYYLEMDEDTSRLSITRVCWQTRSSYYDFTNGTEVEEYSNGKRFCQYQIMKINYYFNNDGDEVVDCYIYTVGIDNVSGSKMNSNVEDYYPFEYLYMQNVKDKSLIKYHITVANRSINGMDIRGLYPYGYRREFMVINYSDNQSSNIEVLQIDEYHNQTPSFDLDSNNIKMLVDNVGLSQLEYESSDTASDLLNKICIQIINNFELKNNWPKIYKESSKAIKVSLIEGPFYGQDIPIEGLSVYVSCRGHYKNEIEFSASADLYDIDFFDFEKKYSLSMGLRSKSTGIVYIIGTDYQFIEEVEYNYNVGYEGERSTYYRLATSNIDIISSAIQISEVGEYDLTCVLTVKEEGVDVIVFDTLENAYLRQYHGLIIPDYTDNNITYSYTVNKRGGKISIIVEEKDNDLVQT